MSGPGFAGSPRWGLLVGLSVCLVLVNACGTQAPRVPEGSSKTGETTKPSVKSFRKSTVVQKRGGAYYKDDGPGDEIPDNLDDLPDAQPRVEPLHRFANRPYIVLGRAYEPLTSVRPYRERGVASWYGKKFHGQMTSIGEPYDMFSMTAAHPTLAIPSYVRVTNVGNGRSVVVRVTDRGPFHADRIIDMSYAAAYRLGYVDNGSTLVDVEAIVPDGVAPVAYVPTYPAPTSTLIGIPDQRDELGLLAARLGGVQDGSAKRGEVPGSSAARGVYLQLGAFASAENAENLRSHLSRELEWLTEGILINTGGGMHRVHLGPYVSRAEAERVAERIRLALGYKPGFVIR